MLAGLYYVYSGCLVLFLKQEFPIAPTKSDLCFIDSPAVPMLDLVLLSASVSVFSVSLGKAGRVSCCVEIQCGKTGDTFQAAVVSHPELA